MKTIKEILAENNFRFNKQFGQNFITDSNLLKAIVCDAKIESDDIVLEIGAGAGTLTRQLATCCKKVVAFEIDRNLVPVLDQTLSEVKDKVELVFSDIQKVSDDQILALTGEKFKVVANLPYYITTPIIMRFLESKLKPQSITVMVQKEVGDRLVAKAGSADYGAITAAVALEGKAEITRVVSRQMFVPQPNVDSCIVNIRLDEQTFMHVDKVAVKLVIKAAFAMRRKTLVNNVMSSLNYSRQEIENALIALGLDVRIRGEMLDIATFVKLSEQLSSQKINK